MTTSVDDYVQAHTGEQGFDVVFDTVGGDVLESAFQAAKVLGSVISIQGGGNHDLTNAFFKSLTFHEVIILIPMPLVPLLSSIARTSFSASSKKLQLVVCSTRR